MILWPAIVCSSVTIWCHDDSDSKKGTTTTISSPADVSVTSTTGTSVQVPAAIAEGSFRAKVTFSLADAVTIGALQLDVGYSRASGRFLGRGESAPCAISITGLLTTQHDDVAAKTLRLGMIALDGFAGPVDLMRCELVYSGAIPVPADFDLIVADVAAPDLSPIVPTPTIVVTIEPGRSRVETESSRQNDRR